MGADYSKVMTLAGSAIVSVSGPEEIVLENYFEYRKQLVKSLTEENEPEPGQEEHEQIVLDLEEETLSLIHI